LGSIKKYCGKEYIIIHENEIMLSYIFPVLNQNINKNINNSNLIDKENLLILINGVDLSVSGPDQKLKSGDIVTIANLIHGG
jgi:hypothetical protein